MRDCPLDRVNRQFHAPAPNKLWVSAFTYVSTWSGARLWAVPPAMPPPALYVAFVIDFYARYIVGWRVSRTAHASFVLDALEQALHDRRPVHRGGLVHHSDRGSQYVSIKYTERLAEAGIEPSARSVGASVLDDAPHHLRASLMTMLCGNDQWHLLGRSDPPPRTMAFLRGRRVRHIGMGRLVQPSTFAGANRQHPARRSRTTILCRAGRCPHGSIT